METKQEKKIITRGKGINKEIKEGILRKLQDMDSLKAKYGVNTNIEVFKNLGKEYSISFKNLKEWHRKENIKKIAEKTDIELQGILDAIIEDLKNLKNVLSKGKNVTKKRNEEFKKIAKNRKLKKNQSYITPSTQKDDWLLVKKIFNYISHPEHLDEKNEIISELRENFKIQRVQSICGGKEKISVSESIDNDKDSYIDITNTSTIVGDSATTSVTEMTIIPNYDEKQEAQQEIFNRKSKYFSIMAPMHVRNSTPKRKLEEAEGERAVKKFSKREIEE